MTSQSVFKHSYVKAGPRGKGSAQAHLRYIQHRHGHDKGEDGYRKFFDKDHDEVNSGRFKNKLANAPDRGVVLHKVILSPGVQSVDLKEYTRDVMEQLGDRKGLDLEWQAVIHKNTQHQHVHVVVLGRDRDGKTVRLSRDDYQFARDTGDRYLDRKHEFDKYFDRSLDNLLKDEKAYNRDFDLDKLFTKYDSDRGPLREKQKKTRKRDDAELQRRYQRETQLPYRRKPRSQRLYEARGRSDRQYFHDLYARNTERERLNRLRDSRPEQGGYVKEQLRHLDELDKERQEDLQRQVAELDRILGLPSAQEKHKPAAENVQAEVATEKPVGRAEDMLEPEQERDEPIELDISERVERSVEQDEREIEDSQQLEQEVEVEQEMEAASGGSDVLQESLQEHQKRVQETHEKDAREQQEREQQQERQRQSLQLTEEMTRGREEAQKERDRHDEQDDRMDHEDIDR